jgi:CheY-like chemotaxis protein
MNDSTLSLQTAPAVQHQPGPAHGAMMNAPARVAPRVPVEPPGSSTTAGKSVAVLVVEDNAINMLLACEMLKVLGCTVTAIGDGLQAVEKAKTGAWDLVLMDWHLPKLDGLEATRRIRAWEESESRAAMKIIALTANAMVGDEDKCLAAGCSDYLTKPFTLAHLKILVDSARAAH